MPRQARIFWARGKTRQLGGYLRTELVCVEVAGSDRIYCWRRLYTIRRPNKGYFDALRGGILQPQTAQRHFVYG